MLFCTDLYCTVLYCTVLHHTDLVLQPVVDQLQHLCRQRGAHADLCVPLQPCHHLTKGVNFMVVELQCLENTPLLDAALCYGCLKMVNQHESRMLVHMSTNLI